MRPEIRDLLLTVAIAASDGRLDGDEIGDILRAAVELVDDEIPDLIQWVGDLLHRDADELLAAAERHKARGHDKRAARLRARAERRR